MTERVASGVAPSRADDLPMDGKRTEIAFARVVFPGDVVSPHEGDNAFEVLVDALAESSEVDDPLDFTRVFD